MAITSVGYGGTVDYPDYGKGVVTPARYSFDGATHFRPSRVTGGADRTVRVTGGTAQGWGIRDTEDSASVDVQLDAVGSGSRWDLIVLRRDWSANSSAGLTSIETINGGSSEAIPARNDYRVTDYVDDQPIALARVQAGQQYVTDVIDLRCWAADGGLVAVHTRALDYLDTPGTRVSIGDQTYTRVLSPAGAASWHQELRQDYGFVTPAQGENWSRNLTWIRTGDEVTIQARPLRAGINITTQGYRSWLYSLPSIARPANDLITDASSTRSNMTRGGMFSVLIEESGSVAIYNNDTNLNITQGTTYHFSITYRAAN